MGSELIIPVLLGAVFMALGWLGKTISHMRKKTDDLWVWHNKEDADGVKIWYLRASLEDTILNLANNIAAQTKVLDKMINKLEQLDRDVREK